MNRFGRLLAITFLESASTILYERGIYFFARERLGFSDAMNLVLAVLFGLVYVLGALGSHSLARRFGEKRILAWAIGAQALTMAAVAFRPGHAAIYLSALLIALSNGLKWPVIESYASAGRDSATTARDIGRFNVAWAGAAPIALGICGPLIAWRSGTPAGDAALFVIAMLLSLSALGLTGALPGRPAHLPQDHPQRPALSHLLALSGLLAASRWSMLASYALLFVLAPLLPGIFENLGFSVATAPALSSLIDWVRLATFVLLAPWGWWHGRVGPLVACVLLLPASFAMVLWGQSVPVVLLGEVIFGATSGLTYYAALYYAMLISNASVNAGGAHESLIGLGFLLGPLAALGGNAAGSWSGHPVAGIFLGVSPLVLVCTVGALKPLLATRCRVR